MVNKKNVQPPKKTLFFLVAAFHVHASHVHACAQKNAKKLNYIAIPFICHLYDHSVTTQS